MSTKSGLLAAAAAGTMLIAGTSGAMAHHFHSFHHPHLRLFIGSGYGYGCGYYFDRWQDTGSFYWKSKYYQCKGWW